MNRETNGTAPEAPNIQHIKETSVPEDLEIREETSTSEYPENGKGISTQEDSEGVESANTEGTSAPEDRENRKGISTQEDSESIESANTQGTSAPKDRENGKGISTREDSEGVEFANTKGTSAPEDQENNKGISTLEASNTVEFANNEGTSASEDQENGKGISTQEDSKAVESAITEGAPAQEDWEIVEERSTPEASESVEFVNTEDTPAPGNSEIVEERATPEVPNNPTFNNDLPTRNSIFYAPDRIRCRRQSDFEPKVVSIGPYFHGIGDLKFAESLKDSCMSDLLNNQPVDMNVLVNKFQKHENSASIFYKEKLSRHSSENFIQMLIRDSCFIIHVILSLSKEVTDYGQACIKEVRSDLLLLENQIPLFFLKYVYNWLASQSELPLYKTVLEQFIGMDMPWKINLDDYGDVAHLLELYWRCSWPPEVNKRLNESPRDSELKQPKSAQNHPWLVHATELNEKAGINFKGLNDKDHKGLSVIFSNGIIRMPRLKIDSSQTTLLVNLIAFETSKSPSEQIFSGYIKLMSALINSEKDVEILEQRSVICNTLSSPKMVTSFFNDVGNFCSISSEEPLFFNLFSNVQKYYNSKWHRAWATLRHDYLKSPWGYISVTAATLLLLLAFSQTGFTIYDHCKRIKHY
ncbi:UPF0481 protein At3g47200-like [Carex rostrata]